MRTCIHCEGNLEPGFIEDAGEASRGNLRWIPGILEKGVFGGAKRFGKLRVDIHAYRCVRCGRLELIVP